MALVAIAGVVAYGFAFSMRQAGTAAKGLVVAELSDAAARMGARHAYEVVLSELAADPTGVTSPVGRHLTDFADHDTWNPAWINPNPPGDYANSNYEFDGDDVGSEAKMFYLQHAWYGGQGKGQAYRSEGGAWPNDGRQTSMMSYGMGRYIEPGYYNANGTTGPVRFSTVPGAAPGFNRPVYYDAAFRPVTSRSLARYRLRYAVNAMDLGGHLIYGRQQAFDAVTAPTEWDAALARTYLPSFYNLLSGQGLNDIGYNPTRPQLQTMFLGLGTSAAKGGDDYYRRFMPGFFLSGFTAAGVPRNFDSIPGIISPPAPVGGEICAGGTGGPGSWTQANAQLDSVGMSGGWATRWVYSPFGRATEYTSTPSRYFQGRTDCPWRINLLSAPAVSVRTMLYAFLPPELTKPVATEEYRYHWVGFTNPPWPGLSSPQWDPNPYIHNVFNPRQPAGAFGPGLHLQADRFSPPYLSGVKPFAGFASADYTVPVTATTFATCYPGPPGEWEDYAAFPGTISRDTDDRDLLRTGMLGGDINLYDTHGSYWSNEFGSLSGRLEFPIAVPRQPFYSNNSKVSGTGKPREPVRGHGGALFFTYQWGGSQENINGDRITYSLDTEQGFFHRDSYWLDIAVATAGTVVLAKSLYFDTASCGTTAVGQACTTMPAKPTHIRDIDRLFLTMLGEYTAADTTPPGSSDTPKPGWMAVRESPNEDWYIGGSRVSIVDNTASANIRGVLKLMEAKGLPNAKKRAANMERVLNDWRMSFFGANPTYTDFAPLDFDGDGKAIASCYTGTVDVDGRTMPGKPASGGIGPPPDTYWSLSGYFVLERGRFWRVLTRGEVFDEVLRKPISESNLEAVFAIDPDGDWTGTTGSLGDSSTLYQRYLTNNYRGYQPMSP